MCHVPFIFDGVKFSKVVLMIKFKTFTFCPSYITKSLLIVYIAITSEILWPLQKDIVEKGHKGP